MQDDTPSKPQSVQSWTIHGCIEGKITCDYNDEFVDRIYIDGSDLADLIGSRCAGLRVRIEVTTLDGAG